MTTTKTKRTGNQTAKPSTAASTKYAHEFRETVETVVFVLVLVSLLRMFGCEAFVIPTGSMATTLLGAHKSATCPECGYTTTVNASDQIQHAFRVDSGLCQNCREVLDLTPAKPKGGDRVLVSKFLYEGFSEPSRWDVAVFKVPEINKYPDNTFIKRLIGKPGETVGVLGGDIYIKPPTSSGGAAEFTIARKPPQVMMAVRRLVYDNEMPAADLVRARYPAHWSPNSAGDWTTSSEGRAFTSSDAPETWLTYRNIIRANPDEPQLITDFEAYNILSANQLLELNWVGDLMLDCSVDLPKDQGRFAVELVEGKRRYQCRFDFEKDEIQIIQDGKSLARKQWPLVADSYHVQFANFDDRLTLWLNGDLVFDDGIETETTDRGERGPTPADLEPIKIGSFSTVVTVSGLCVYRDIYYTQTAQFADARFFPRRFDSESLADLRVQLASRPMKEFSVPEDSFFMLGDNSPKSSDGREWTNKFVPRHLVLGRALILYWPIWNWKFVR